MRYVIALACLAGIAACSNLTARSAYQSGWIQETSEDSFRQCAPSHVKKGMLIPQNLERLIALGMLSQDQAHRASVADVRPGDPECLAYAAYGMFFSEMTTTKRNSDGALLERGVSYICTTSEAPCPGVTVQIIDGKVASISAIQ